MMMIREEIVTPDKLVSNVPITETAWTAGTYTTGTKRYVGTDLYEVTASPSTADEPTAGAAAEVPSWVRIGKINRWKMFSEFVSEKTVHTSPITIEIETSPNANGLALFGVDASYAEVITYSNSEETSRSTIPLSNVYDVSDWYTYFFQPINRVEELVVVNLPTYGTDRVVLTLTSEDPTISVGKVVVGEVVHLGTTLLNFSTGIEDFSRKERDDFGGLQVLERRFARRAEFYIHIPAPMVAGIMRHLAAVRAQPTVYIGDPNVQESILIGFYKDVWITRQTHTTAEMTLEIEGLT